MRLAFVVHSRDIFNHYKTIVDALPCDVDLLACFAKNYSTRHDDAATLRADGYSLVDPYSVGKRAQPYDAIISNHLGGLPLKRRRALGERQINMVYSLGDLEWVFGEWNRHFDAALCYGPYQQRIFDELFPYVKTAGVGYPRLDAVFENAPTRGEMAERLGLDPARRIVVWLPTLGDVCSIDAYCDSVSALTDTYSVIVKPHPATPSEQVARLKSAAFHRLVEGSVNNAHLIDLADFVIADYGGSMFASIYLDANVLLLNMPNDVFSMFTGPFSPDIHARNHIANVSDGAAIRPTLEDPAVWEDQKTVRRVYRDYLFADVPKGRCGKYAAEAVMRFAGEPVRTGTPEAPAGALTMDLARIVPAGVLETRYPYPDWAAAVVRGYGDMKMLREKEKRLAKWQNMGVFKFVRRRLRRMLFGTPPR
ncbi:MAG: CDP-glycerol glycerophosphotransferase family protein [Planctomycetota bacterium]|jgi:hypothetical protein|nr:CDP-glycerol glycerophosphotransferase family protein [Planctomycetota bacterium]